MHIHVLACGSFNDGNLYSKKLIITVVSNYTLMEYLGVERLLEVGLLSILILLLVLLLLSSKENVLLRNIEDCIGGVASTDGVVVVASPFRSWLEFSSDNSRNTS